MGTVLTISILCFVFGAIIGSFLSVCAHRIPAGKYEPSHDKVRTSETRMSILSPARSICPVCKKQLLWWHNIPIVSWMILGGKCGHCSTAIPFRYVFIEVFTGVVSTLCYWRFGLSPTGFLAFAVLCSMIVITFIDLDYMIIPNVISYPGTILGFAIAGTNELVQVSGRPVFQYPFAATLEESLLGVLGGAGLLTSVWWLYLKIRRREGLGLGDVKLLAMVGTIFGLECAWFTIFIGSVLGSIIGIAIIVASRKGFSHYIPFGPYLVAALMIYVLDGIGIYDLIVHGNVPATWWLSGVR